MGTHRNQFLTGMINVHALTKKLSIKHFLLLLLALEREGVNSDGSTLMSKIGAMTAWGRSKSGKEI